MDFIIMVNMGRGGVAVCSVPCYQTSNLPGCRF